MKTMIGAAILVSACAIADATGARYDVKGVPLGAAESEVNAVVGGDLKCTDVPPRMRQATPTGRACRSNDNGRSFAGIEASVQYWMDERSHVAVVSVGIIQPGDFEPLLSAMNTKYGKPEIRKTELMNRLGARFENATAHWRNAAGDHIVLERYNTALAQPLDAGSLRFYSAEFEAHAERSEKKQQKEAASDM